MADITKEELKKEITAILKDADLTTMSAKKVRQQVENKLDCELSNRKEEIDDILMNCLRVAGKKGSKKNGKGDADDDEEEEEEEEDEEEDDEEEKPKRSTKKTPQKRKKESSDESGSDAEEKEESEEEYSPAKKTKGKPKAKPAGKGKKKKAGSDSDSDEDWGKGSKKGGGAKKGGAKKGGGGYTKVCNLSPELAAVVGADQMARHEVVKKVWSIIKEKNLYDPQNKQYAICNDELLKVFGVKRFRTFGMMKFLKNHFVP